MKIEIHRVSCRACDEIFCGATSEEAKKKHQQHIKQCQTIKALKKIERFRKKAEKILGRKANQDQRRMRCLYKGRDVIVGKNMTCDKAKEIILPF